MLKPLRKVIKGNNPTTLLVFNLLIFATLILAPIFCDLNWEFLVGSLFVYFLNICCGVSTTYHRALTHLAFKMPKWLERTFATFACLAGTGSPIMWVMTHRQHHRFADKEGDPHPPSGVWKTIFGVYPRVTSHIRDIVRDKYYTFWHRHYFGLVILWGAFLALFGMNAFFFLFVVPITASITVSNALNWWGHKESMISYRNYDLRDYSQNNWPMAFFAFGEGWHNNHHRHPGSAQFGIKKWEIDVSYLVIRGLQFLGLATQVKTPRKELL